MEYPAITENHREKKIEWTLGVYRGITFLFLAGNAGMEKKMETSIMACIGTDIGIHSIIPSKPNVSVEQTFKKLRVQGVEGLGW